MPRRFISWRTLRPNGVRPPGRWWGAMVVPSWVERRAASAKALWQFHVRVAARTPRA